MPEISLKIHAYIDGFNLYYGALKRTPYKWLDVGQFCQRLAPKTGQIDRVNYFTARVQQQPGNSGVRERQRVYLSALRNQVPNINIVFGQYRTHANKMRLLTPGDTLEQRDVSGRGQRICGINRDLFNKDRRWKSDPGPTVHVIKIEEKGSDVNLAARLIHDAHTNAYDGALVISNDTDLCEALRIVINEVGKPVWLVSPYRSTAGKLRSVLKTKPRVIYESVLKNSQMPAQIPNTNLSKPRVW